MRVLPKADDRADIAPHEREISRNVLRASFQRRELLRRLARTCVVVICVMALAGCSGITYSHVTSHTANSGKFTEPTSGTPTPLRAAPRSRMISQTANTEKLTEPKPARPIPLPAAPLLVPQPEPNCEATDASANERQKLDYERQCYRHAEMIVRARLQLLQGSVDKTISAVRSSDRSDP